MEVWRDAPFQTVLIALLKDLKYIDFPVMRKDARFGFRIVAKDLIGNQPNILVFARFVITYKVVYKIKSILLRIKTVIYCSLISKIPLMLIVWYKIEQAEIFYITWEYVSIKKYMTFLQCWTCLCYIELNTISFFVVFRSKWCL